MLAVSVPFNASESKDLKKTDPSLVARVTADALAASQFRSSRAWPSGVAPRGELAANAEKLRPSGAF